MNLSSTDEVCGFFFFTHFKSYKAKIKLSQLLFFLLHLNFQYFKDSMEEKFLHYIWQHKLYNPSKFELPSKEKVEIINQGEYNTNSGPDFFNAKVKIGNTIWAGNIEIHVNSSDWFNHNHHLNDEYNNIILHVVFKNDKDIYRKNGELIPTVEINFYKSVYDNYKNLLYPKNSIKCSNYLSAIDTFHIDHWIDQLAIERLNNKSEYIKRVLKRNINNWEETFYQVLAGSFGLKINSFPFEQIAINLPNKILAKHKNNLFQIEALLFGQAGFVNEKDGDDYYLKLHKEYHFFKKKYNLVTGNKNLWKFMRLRPGNFPTIRIAQFAYLIHQSSNLFSQIINCQSFIEFEKLFNLSTSEYWKSHYIFNKESKYQRKKFGKTTFYTIMINAVIPIIFLYAKTRNNQEQVERSLELLEKIPAEKNSIIEKWKNLGISCSSAYRSQAIIHLNNEYCRLKKCLNCQIGHRILTKNI